MTQGKERIIEDFKEGGRRKETNEIGMHSAVILFQKSMAEYIPKGMLRTKITDTLSKNVGSDLKALNSKRDSDQSEAIKDSKANKGSEKIKTYSSKRYSHHVFFS